MRSRHRRLAVLASALAAVLTLAGCTSTTASDGTTASPSTSFMSSSDSVSPTPSPTSAPSSSPIAIPPTSAPATSDALPTDLTPDQVAQAQAALTAYRGYIALVDQAYTDPVRDWSSEVAKLATDPVKSQLLTNLAETADAGERGDGTVVVEPQVTKVEPGVVTISACVDSTNTNFYDKSGASIKAPDAPGSYFRHRSNVTVAKFVGDQWLVYQIVDDYRTSC